MPSRLITYTGAMAAPMDVSDPEGGRGKSGSALSVSRSSTKINKNLRRAVTQPRPAPQVYKTEPAEFRSLVQQLTGTSSPEPSTILTPKPLNPRLQNLAPPPLRPVFSYPTGHQQSSQHQNLSEFNPGPRIGRFNSMPPSFTNPNQAAYHRPPNFPVPPLSFSPLPVLTPRDQIWANILNPVESPGSAALRHLGQSMTGGGSGGDAARDEMNSMSTMVQPHNANHLPNANLSSELSRFGGPSPLKFLSPFSLSSPGLVSGYGLGSMFGFGGQFSPSAAALDDPFDYPDSDLPRLCALLWPWNQVMLLIEEIHTKCHGMQWHSSVCNGSFERSNSRGGSSATHGRYSLLWESPSTATTRRSVVNSVSLLLLVPQEQCVRIWVEVYALPTA
uniref:VQ domain-containing protein n=1 Tax=Physcomitrium patens TaxID=3218 RepID=A0A7I4E4P3_PHYPA